MKKPLVSVIIPAYNGESYLSRAIESILNQTYPYLEIWVIDNGSKDQTAKIARSFPKVQYSYLETPDTAQARNLGILKSKGELIAFLDQDDVWTKDKLEKQICFLEENLQAAAAVCYQKMVLEKGHKKPHWLKGEFLQSAQTAYLPSALLVRRKALEKTHLFDASFSLTSDVAWFFKAKHRGFEVGILKETLLIRYIHGQNASNRYKEVQKGILSIIHSSLKERRAKISVIIAVYNGEKYLKEAIESALAQDYANKEILVINDGSIDSTQKIIDHYGTHVRSFYQENKGLGAARNKGIEMARGSYLAFLDHDDFWDKDKLTLQMEKMDERDPLVFSHVKQFVCPTLSFQEKKKLQVNGEILPAYFAGNLLVSKKRFLAVGLFFEKKVVGEFVDWYLRALEAKVPIVMLEKLALYRRVHNQNMGRQKELYERKEYLKILKNSLERRRAHATSS